MVPSAAAAVVLLAFPFSDLSGSRLRPAVVLADAGRGDWILCQVTSNAYSDPLAVEIHTADFDSGSLRRISYVRPGKLFTSNEILITTEIGRLSVSAFARVLDAVIGVIDPTR